MQSEVSEVSAIKRELKSATAATKSKKPGKNRRRVVQDRVEIKGFRRGKAPVSVIQGQYKNEIQRQVTEVLLEEGVESAMREHQLVPVGPLERASEELPTPEVGQPITFAVQFEVRPQITLGTYKGLAVKKPTAVSGDSEVERELDKFAAAPRSWCR